MYGQKKNLVQGKKKFRGTPDILARSTTLDNASDPLSILMNTHHRNAHCDKTSSSRETLPQVRLEPITSTLKDHEMLPPKEMEGRRIEHMSN